MRRVRRGNGDPREDKGYHFRTKVSTSPIETPNSTSTTDLIDEYNCTSYTSLPSSLQIEVLQSALHANAAVSQRVLGGM